MVRRSSRIKSVEESAASSRSNASALSSAVAPSASASVSSSSSFSSFAERRVHFGSSPATVLGVASGHYHSVSEIDHSERDELDDDSFDSSLAQSPRLTSLLPYDYSFSNARSNPLKRLFSSNPQARMPATPTAIEAAEDSIVYRTDICDQHGVNGGASTGCQNPHHQHQHQHQSQHAQQNWNSKSKNSDNSSMFSSIRALNFSDSDQSSHNHSSIFSSAHQFSSHCIALLPRFPRFAFPTRIPSFSPLLRFPLNFLFATALFFAAFSFFGFPSFSLFDPSPPHIGGFSAAEISDLRVYLLSELRKEISAQDFYLPRTEFAVEKTEILKFIKTERGNAIKLAESRIRANFDELLNSRLDHEKRASLALLTAELLAINEKIANRTQAAAEKLVNPCEKCDFKNKEFVELLRETLREATEKQLKQIESASIAAVAAAIAANPTANSNSNNHNEPAELNFSESNKLFELEFTATWNAKLATFATREQIKEIEGRLDEINAAIEAARERTDKQLEQTRAGAVERAQVVVNKEVDSIKSELSAAAKNFNTRGQEIEENLSKRLDETKLLWNAELARIDEFIAASLLNSSDLSLSAASHSSRLQLFESRWNEFQASSADRLNRFDEQISSIRLDESKQLIGQLNSSLNAVDQQLKIFIEQKLSEFRKENEIANRQRDSSSGSSSDVAKSASESDSSGVDSKSSPVDFSIQLNSFWTAEKAKLQSELDGKWQSESEKIISQLNKQNEIIQEIKKNGEIAAEENRKQSLAESRELLSAAAADLRERILAIEQSHTSIRNDFHIAIKEENQRLEDRIDEFTRAQSVSGAAASPDKQNAEEILAQVRRMIADALNHYSADRTSLVDYALKSSGGRIVASSRSHQLSSAAADSSLSLISFVKKCFLPAKKPDEMLNENMSVGSCWPMAGTRGFAVIQLRESIRPTAVTIQHIDQSIAPDYSTAPRNISFFGLSDDLLPGIESAGFNISNPVGDYLGNFEYQFHGGQIQKFTIQTQRIYQFIAFQINSNHGNNEYTCVYRVRIHGDKNPIDANDSGNEKEKSAGKQNERQKEKRK